MALQTVTLKFGAFGDENQFEYSPDWTVSKLFKMALGAVLNKAVNRPDECLKYTIQMIYEFDLDDARRDGLESAYAYIDYNKDGRKKVKTLLSCRTLMGLTVFEPQAPNVVPQVDDDSSDETSQDGDIITFKLFVVDMRGSDATKHEFDTLLMIGRTRSISSILLAISEVLSAVNFLGLGKRGWKQAVFKIGQQDEELFLNIRDMFLIQKFFGDDTNGNLLVRIYNDGDARFASFFEEKVDDITAKPSDASLPKQDELPDAFVVHEDLNVKPDDCNGKVVVKITTSLRVHRFTFYCQKHSTFSDVVASIRIAKGITIGEDTVMGLYYKDSRLPLYETVSSLCLPEGDCLEVRGSFKAGGVQRGVVKSVVKSKVGDKTTQADMPKFERAYAHSIGVSTSTTDGIKTQMMALGVSDLNAMLDYVNHDKTPMQKKLACLASYLPAVREMEEVQQKLNTSIEDARSLMVSYLEQACNASTEQGVKKANLTKMLETRIAVLQEVALQNSQSKGDGKGKSSDATMRD